MQKLKFSEALAEQVRDALICRVVDVIRGDEDAARSIVEYGFTGVFDLDGIELMDEYMNWHGTFSIEESPDDTLLQRMSDEQNGFELEKEILLDEKV